MEYINFTIKGIPYGKNKRRGDLQAPKRWTDEIVKQTINLPKVKEACIMKATFFLPQDKYPTDLPYGSDLDNLLKRLLDGLNSTIFSDAIGGDSCVISLTAMKIRVDKNDKAGVNFEILPIHV